MPNGNYRTDGSIAKFFEVKEAASARELEALKRAITKLEQEIAKGMLPSVLLLFPLAFFGDSLVVKLLCFALWAFIIGGTTMRVFKSNRELKKRSREIFLEEFDKAADGELGKIDAEALSVLGLWDHGITRWSEARFGNKVTETAKTLSPEYLGSIKELFDTARAIEESD